MPALVIGSALAGAVQVLVPREALLAIGSNPALSIVAMIALAMVVSICSNVDAFFALSFASTFTPGSIVAFLLVGPARRRQDARPDAHHLHDPHARRHRGRRAAVGLRDRDGGEPPCLGASGSARAGSASAWHRRSPSSRSASRSPAASGSTSTPTRPGSRSAMAVVLLVGAALSFPLPLGAESDHGHDHGHDEGGPTTVTTATTTTQPRGIAARGHGHGRGRGIRHRHRSRSCCRPRRCRPSSRCRATSARRRCSRARMPSPSPRPETRRRSASASGRRCSRPRRTPRRSTATRWSSPDSSRPASGDFDLTRLVITHCVIDAQTASVPVVGVGPVPETGQWVTVTGRCGRPPTGG